MRWTCSAPRPNLASSVRASAIGRPVAAMNASSSDSSPSSSERACSISPTTTLGTERGRAGRRLDPAEQHRDQGASCRCRSPRPGRCDRRRGGRDRPGPSRNDPRSTTAPRAVATTSPLRPARRDRQPQLPGLPRLVDRLETFGGLLGARGPPGELLGLVDLEVADVLVGLARLLHLRLTLRGPLPLALGPLLQRRTLRVVLVEALLGVQTCELAFGEERRPSARVPLGAVRVVVDLDHVGDRPARGTCGRG